MINTYSPQNRFLFWILSFVFWFSHFIYIPMLSPYIEWMGGQYAFTGIVLSSYGLMQFLFRLPFGIGSDLLKVRKPFIILGMAISAFSCLAFAMTESLGWILFARALAGLAAATWVAFPILFSSYFADHELHRAMSSISLAVVMAQLLGMMVSGYIVEAFGWHSPFWIGGVIGLAGLLASLFIIEPKEKVQRKPVELKELASVLKEKALLKVSILSILAHSIIFTTMFGFIPAYALHIGFTAKDISFLVFCFMVPHAFATFFSGSFFAKKWGKWRTLTVAFGATACFTMAIPFAESKEWLGAIQAVNGFSLGLVFPLFLGMAVETIAHEKRATAMGAYQALYAIGMFAGPFIAGILNTIFGIEAGFYFSGAAGAAAFGLSILWSRKKVKKPAWQIETK